jgi:hypothetical protein
VREPFDPRLELAEAAAFASFAEHAGLPLLRVAGATCYATPPVPGVVMFNRVVGLGLGVEPVDDAVLDAIDAFFGEAGTRYGVSLASGQPDLRDRLVARGFAEGYAWMKFRRGVSAPTPADTSLRVEETRDGAEFGRVAAAAFGLPAFEAIFAPLAAADGWHLFLARDGTQAVACGALYANDGAGWLGIGGTRPEHRGRGAQGAILAARVERARQLALEILTTETGERLPDRPSASYRNILRAGFDEAYLRPNLETP